MTLRMTARGIATMQTFVSHLAKNLMELISARWTWKPTVQSICQNSLPNQKNNIQKLPKNMAKRKLGWNTGCIKNNDSQESPTTIRRSEAAETYNPFKMSSRLS